MRKRRHGQEGMTLIELLVGMIVATILTTMILGTWFALSGSFSYSMTSNFQRDDARNALSRMQREIRDAEAHSPIHGQDQPALYFGDAYTLAFFTTFNTTGNTSPTTEPTLVAYRLYNDGSLWRFSDTGGHGYTAGDGVIEGVAGITPGSATNVSPSDSLIEQQDGEGAREVLGHVVNSRPDPAPKVPLFTYLTASGGTPTWSSSVATQDRTNTLAVTSRILEDLKPGHSPVYVDLQVTSQLRNQRQ